MDKKLIKKAYKDFARYNGRIYDIKQSRIKLSDSIKDDVNEYLKSKGKRLLEKKDEIVDITKDSDGIWLTYLEYSPEFGYHENMIELPSNILDEE